MVLVQGHLVLEVVRDLVAALSVRLQQLYSLVVEPAPFQVVQDPAAVVLLWPTRSGLLVLVVLLVGRLCHLAILDRAVLVQG